MTNEEKKLKALHEETQEALQASEERYKELFENANDIIYTHDLKGTFTSINQEAVRVFGYTAKEAKKVNIAQIVDPKYLPLAMQKIQEKLKGSTATKPYELLTRTKKGEPIWVEVSTRLLKENGQPIGVQGIARDVTIHKKNEEAQKEFVSLASHQLRSPLTVIKLVTSTLAQEEINLSNKKQQEYLDKIAESTEGMIKLVEDLLNVSRLEAGHLKPELESTQLENFVEKIIEEVKVLAESAKCNFVFEKPSEKLPEIHIDPGLMKQVVHNLLTNAVRYSPEGGCEIVVTLGLTEDQRKGSASEISVQDQRQRSAALISVKDNGIGIPKENQHKVFDKFFRTATAKEKEKGGTGLGLYLAKMIVEDHGGKIWFESAGEGQGTTFYVIIPLRTA